MKKNMSRRLRHFKQNIDIFVKTDTNIIGLENKVRENINDFIILESKYVQKGHTKENDIKKLENRITTKLFNDGVLINVNLHLHHYSKFYFDRLNFIYHLTEKLSLPANSIMIVEQPKQTKQTRVEVPVPAPAPLPQLEPQPEKISNSFI